MRDRPAGLGRAGGAGQGPAGPGPPQRGRERPAARGHGGQLQGQDLSGGPENQSAAAPLEGGERSPAGPCGAASPSLPLLRPSAAPAQTPLPSLGSAPGKAFLHSPSPGRCSRGSLGYDPPRPGAVSNPMPRPELI